MSKLKFAQLAKSCKAKRVKRKKNLNSGSVYCTLKVHKEPYLLELSKFILIDEICYFCIFQEADRVIESIENLGNQTIDAIEKSAIESAQFVKSLTQNFQASQELRLDGISKQLTRSFTSFELKLVEGTNMVMNELTSFRSSVSDGIRKLTCLANRNDLYPDIRIFEDTLKGYSGV